MIHEAYMPVYMGPRFSLHTGSPEVVQEALADLKNYDLEHLGKGIRPDFPPLFWP